MGSPKKEEVTEWHVAVGDAFLPKGNYNLRPLYLGQVVSTIGLATDVSIKC